MFLFKKKINNHSFLYLHNSKVRVVIFVWQPKKKRRNVSNVFLDNKKNISLLPPQIHLHNSKVQVIYSSCDLQKRKREILATFLFKKKIKHSFFLYLHNSKVRVVIFVRQLIKKK